MKMSEFKIQNYRSINDSGWVGVDDIAAIVGKNESGKTSLLKALVKFNPFKSDPYSLDREWPRGRRKDRSPEKVVSTVRFEFSEQELVALKGISPIFSKMTGVEIARKYSGERTYQFMPSPLTTKMWAKDVMASIRLPNGTSAKKEFITKVNQEVKAVVEAFDGTSSADAKKVVEELKKKIVAIELGQDEQDELAAVTAKVDEVAKIFSEASPVSKAITSIEKWIPKFIYMDDHKAFAGSAHLNQVKERRDQGRLTDEDKTIILIMEMSGLNLDEEVQKGAQQDREQRTLDMNDASQTLSKMSTRWGQKKYEVQFAADGHHFMTFVKDEGATSLVPLDERSKGFQWFFSFDMTFAYETDGNFKNAVILLDEPGLHLHAEAQRDLLKRFKAYAEDNQLIYTTHLPFMIDSSRLDNIWVAEENQEHGSRITQNWETADKDARFTLEAALGISWSQSLLVAKDNLVVEGVTDFWILNSLSTIFKDGGQEGIEDGLSITPAGGGTKAAYVGTLLNGQKLNVAVLLDSDLEGKSAQKQLVNQWILKDDHVLLIGDVLGRTENVAIEDLFGEDYYLQMTSEAYASELNKQSLTVEKNQRSIVDRVEAALKSKGIEKFNKGRVAKKIMTDLSKKTIKSLDQATLNNFSKVFASINEIVRKWNEPTASKKAPVSTARRQLDAVN